MERTLEASPIDDRKLTELDIHLFKNGTHFRLYEKLGAHRASVGAEEGVHFAVWAPNADAVSVIGDFNQWRAGAHPLQLRPDGSGVWEGFVSSVEDGALYKYHVASKLTGHRGDKTDPFAVATEMPPGASGRIWALDFEWNDADWMKKRQGANAADAPISIYELHLGSWRRASDDDKRLLTYREIAPLLADYVCDLGFTHVELMPVTEHLSYPSCGYQTSDYFAPTARYGTPQDLMFLVDHLHQRGIGVILDWVPSHFPAEDQGLTRFDGSYLFEHADPKRGFQLDLNSHIFNYNRPEVRAFLASSAMFWLDKYHIDGLRVNSVTSMLFLDYGRKEGEWLPNRYGGKENLEAIAFLKELNEAVYREYPDVQTIAEETTSWPMVSRPVYAGGLGFGMKWNLGWVHDTLAYFAQDPVFRKYHHGNLTLSLLYAFSENFVLALPHDEMAHGKGALVARMPGDEWQQFANLRLLLGYMWSQPGKKLIFMGTEFGQPDAWQSDQSLDWQSMGHPLHGGLMAWVRDLNHLYRSESALHQGDFSSQGFEWIDCHDFESSIISFMRRDQHNEDNIIVVCNMTPMPRQNYIVGVPRGGFWQEVLNSDAPIYGGSGVGNFGGVRAAPIAAHGRYHSLTIDLPPLGVVIMKSAS